MKTLINEPFKKLIKNINLKSPVTEISVLTGFSKSVVSEVYNDKRQASENFLRVLKEKILEQNEQNNISEPNENYLTKRKNQKLLDKKKNTVPFYDDVSATASNIPTNMTNISYPSESIDVGDLLSDSQAAIRIYSNSMLPNYPPGCVVGVVQTTATFIQPGEVYVIETDDQRLLKRLFYKDDDPESSVFVCYSDNTMKFEGGARAGKEAYPPFHLPKKSIKKMFIVTGVIKRNTNSLIINRK